MNLDQLTKRIQQAHEALQNYVVKAINIGLTLRNWLIGYYIVEYEQKGKTELFMEKDCLKVCRKSLRSKILKTFRRRNYLVLGSFI